MLINETGITVKQLKEWIKDLPEADIDGDEFEVWIDGTDCEPGLTNVCKSVSMLSFGDILLGVKD